MVQPDLFGGGAVAPSPAAGQAARQEASRSAAEKVARGKGHHQVLWALLIANDIPTLKGLNDYEIAYTLGREGMRGSVAKRRGEMCWPHVAEADAMVTFLPMADGGTTMRRTDTTNRAVVHRLTDRGLEAAQSLGHPWGDDGDAANRFDARLAHLILTANSRSI